MESEAKRSPGNGKSDTEGNYLRTFYDKSFLAELLTAILDNSVGVKFEFSKISALKKYTLIQKSEFQSLKNLAKSLLWGPKQGF